MSRTVDRPRRKPPLTWGLAALLILFPEPFEAAFGPLGYTNPLFILAVYAPGLAVLFLVLGTA